MLSAPGCVCVWRVCEGKVMIKTLCDNILPQCSGVASIGNVTTVWHGIQHKGHARVVVVCRDLLPTTVLRTVSLSSIINMNISKCFFQGHLNMI